MAQEAYAKAKEALKDAEDTLTAAVLVMNRLRAFKTHKDTEMILLMRQRFKHTRGNIDRLLRCLDELEKEAEQVAGKKR